MYLNEIINNVRDNKKNCHKWLRRDLREFIFRLLTYS